MKTQVKQQRKKGFTLVELVVVIVILGILAVVAVPAYSGYIDKANDRKLITEVGAISTAANSAAQMEGKTLLGFQINDAGLVTFSFLSGDVPSNFSTEFCQLYANVTPGAGQGAGVGPIGLFSVTAYAAESGMTVEGPYKIKIASLSTLIANSKTYANGLACNTLTGEIGAIGDGRVKVTMVNPELTQAFRSSSFASVSDSPTEAASTMLGAVDGLASSFGNFTGMLLGSGDEDYNSFENMIAEALNTTPAEVRALGSTENGSEQLAAATVLMMADQYDGKTGAEVLGQLAEMMSGGLDLNAALSDPGPFLPLAGGMYATILGYACSEDGANAKAPDGTTPLKDYMTTPGNVNNAGTLFQVLTSVNVNDPTVQSYLGVSQDKILAAYAEKNGLDLANDNDLSTATAALSGMDQNEAMQLGIAHSQAAKDMNGFIGAMGMIRENQNNFTLEALANDGFASEDMALMLAQMFGG